MKDSYYRDKIGREYNNNNNNNNNNNDTDSKTIYKNTMEDSLQPSETILITRWTTE